METTYSVITLCPSTKEEAENFAAKLIAEVETGEVNPLTLHIKLTAMQKAIEEVKKKIADMTLLEAEKYGQKKFETQGAEVAISELGTKYAYELCGDPLWNEASEQINQWGEKKKQREAFLKTIHGSMDVIIEGEPLTLKEAQKSSTTGLKITLK